MKKQTIRDLIQSVHFWMAQVEIIKYDWSQDDPAYNGYYSSLLDEAQRDLAKATHRLDAAMNGEEAVL